MVHCVAFGCHERSENGNKGFFLFPKDDIRRKKWIDAVGSLRNIGGKIVPFVPSKTSRLCKRHFVDEDYKHPPSVMESLGVQLKLQLKDTAVPSVFPDSDNYKENQKPLCPADLGAAKRKRNYYGAYEKRKRMQEINLMIQNGGVNVSSTAAVNSTENQCDLIQVSDSDLSQTNLVSRATQTDPPIMVNKSCQIHPSKQDKCVEAITIMSDQGTGPDENPTVDESKEDDWDDQISDLDDSIEDDPDWCIGSDMSSDEDSEDEDWCTFDSNDQENNRFWIVSEKALMTLILICNVCGNVPTVVKKLARGAMLSVSTLCECGMRQTWESMNFVRGTPEVNLKGCGALAFSGASISKVLNIFNFMNVAFVKYRTYCKIQRSFILPTIDSVWKRRQAQILKDLKGRSVRAGGDARCCTPGHTAKYGSYTIMDLESGNILDVKLVQANEVKNSNAMELEGLKRCLEYLDSNGVTLSDLTTDRHVQVRKYMREERKDINHWFDGWHLAKNVKKKLLALGKKKKCEVISEWSQSISNFLYFCAATSGGDGDLVQDKWLSILNHVTNKHEGHGGRYPKCRHGPVDREWIQPGSKAHKELKLIIANKRLINDIKKSSPAEQTSKLEAQHKVVCQFAPKFYSFSYRSMEKRLYLAALHSTSNNNRKQAITQQGTPRYQLSYPKFKAGQHVVKAVKESVNYDYVDELMEELLNVRKRHRSHTDAEIKFKDQLTSPPPMCSKAQRVTKEEAVKQHKTRFNFDK